MESPKAINRLLIALATAAFCGIGCSSAPNKSVNPSMQRNVLLSLSPEQAAKLGAQLANDESARLYKKRPFSPEQYEARLADGLYHWGHLEVGGPSGLSAEVSFRPDGSDPHVRVWFSTDIL